MLGSKLTLVLGAGASRDFGQPRGRPFPLGDDLRDQIAKGLNIEMDPFGRDVTRGDPSIFSAYHFASRSSGSPSMKVGLLVAAGQEIASALPGCESIDDFLERHSGDEVLETSAKIAIARCILRAESESPLSKNPTATSIPEISTYRAHWLSRFLQTITKRASLADLPDVFSKLKVINFNYDRCFEWFCHLWLRHVYRLKQREADEILRGLEIIHPYGSLGKIFGARTDGMSFGHEATPKDLYEISRNISTYSESVEQDKRPYKIREMVDGSTRYIFVGFAFHQQNMDLLKFETPRATTEIYATTVGMPLPRWENAQGRLRESLSIGHGVIEFFRSEESGEDLVSQFGDRWSS